MQALTGNGGLLVPLNGEGGSLQAAVGLAVAAHVEAPSAAGESAPGAKDSRPAFDLLHDVEMEVTAELGRTRMSVRELLSLTPGAVIELDRAAGGPADLLVNGRLIARGEVVVIDENFGIRITEIVGPSDRA
jgi:flagellar motor switch protein FliN/FliY